MERNKTPSQAASGVTVSVDESNKVSRSQNSDTSQAGPVSDSCPDKGQIIAAKRETADTEALEAIDGILDACTWYQCAGREARVAEMRIAQAVWDRVSDLGLKEDGQHLILTGSWAEGMPREICGDIDMMVTNSDYPVLLCEPPTEDTTSLKPQTVYVVAESSQSQRAYIKLSVCGDISDIGSDEIKQSVVQDGKGQWLSSLKLMGLHGDDENEIHGPALMSAINDNDPAEGLFDGVICLRCPTWPPCAADFLHRPRPHGIPSQSLIQSIAAAGCHVVATGHPDSQDRDLEWRWSFSVAEKDIIHDMDRAMAGAMYVLKILKKHDDNIPAGICSYYYKTACLFLNEGVPHTGILDLARQALDWLIACYQKHSIPHYFIPDQNLIGHLPQNTCTEMAHTLIDAKSRLQLYVLCGLQKNPVIAEVVHSIQDSISFSPQSDDTEVKTGVFLTSLLKQGNVGQVLEAASRRMRPGNDTYIRKELEVDVCIEELKNDIISNDLLLTRTPSELVIIPEDVILPVIDNMDHIVKQEFVNMETSTLYSWLGLKYLALSFYIVENLSTDNEMASVVKASVQDDETSSGDDSTLESKDTMSDTSSSEGATGSQKHTSALSAERRCLVKSEEFLHKGIPLVLHNGFDDLGLSGYVHLTVYYFLTKQWDQALGTSNKAINIIDEVDDLMVHVNGLHLIYVDMDSILATVLLKQDETLYQCLEQSGNEHVYFNPVPLAYYFQARLALRQADIEVAQTALVKMTEMKETLLEVYQTSTDILINTIVFQLGVFLD